MKIKIEVESKFNVDNYVTVKFAGTDFGEYDTECGTVVAVKYSSERNGIVYDIQFKDRLQKNIPEHQVS